MRTLFLVLLCAAVARAADVCPGAPGEGSGSWSAKVAKKFCVGSQFVGLGSATWRAAGIASAEVRGALRVEVCCFDVVAVAPAALRMGDREVTIPTHQEADEARGKGEDFPDLIEDDAREKTVAIRGTFWDGARPVSVDVLLKCSASKFAEQYAYQFTVIDRSPDAIAIEWDHLRRMRDEAAPQIQGPAFVFLSPKHPREAAATVALKTKAGKLLGSFQFDSFTW